MANNPQSFLAVAGIGLIWCSFTFAFDGWIGWIVVKQSGASRYPSTTGTVIFSAVKHVGGRRREPYEPDVRYSYEVAGDRYESDRLRYDPTSTYHVQAAAHAAKYPVNQAVTVYYNPRFPADAVLETDFERWNVPTALLALTPFNAAAFGFVGFIFSWLRAQWRGLPLLSLSVRDDGLHKTIRIYDQSPALLAITALGLVGVLSIFGGALLTWVLPEQAVLVIAWIVVMGAAATAWWMARKKFVEIRRDGIRGKVEVRNPDGSLRHELTSPQFESARRFHRRGAQDTDREERRYFLQLRYQDEDQRTRMLKLRSEVTEREAAKFVDWVNGVLAGPGIF